jgi:hypothetical protein
MPRHQHRPEAEILETQTDKARDMTAITLNASNNLRTYAATKWPLLNNKGRIARLTKELPTFGHRRVRAIYNAEEGVSLRADEQSHIDQLTAEAKHEYRTITALCQGLEALLSHTDADGYSAQIDALRAISRSMDRPGNHGGR